MQASSTAFAEAIQRSHQAPIRAELWSPLEGLIATLTTVLDGSVSIDARRTIRRTANVSLVDDTGTLAPDTALDALAPFGTELHLYRGVTTYTGDELMALGVIVLDDVNIRETAGGVQIDVSGFDRSARIQRNRWPRPFVIPAGTPIEDAIEAILSDRWPPAQVDLIETGETTPRIVLEHGSSSDPWRDAVRLAVGAGLDLYFDATGVARLREVPEPGTAPDVEYAPGDTNALLDAERRFSASTTYSGVIASGESSANTTPVRAEVWDDNPDSPTYRYGPFGEVPYFYVSPLLKTRAQAAKAATSLLSKVVGAGESVGWTQIVDPRLDAYDIVRITSDGVKITARDLMLDALTIPLSPTGTMAATGRSSGELILSDPEDAE